MNFQNILVVIDPTSETDQPSLHRAEQLADVYPQATFTLFLCDYNSALDGGILFATPGLEKAQASLIKQNEVFLEKLSKTLRGKGVKVHLNSVWGKRLDRNILHAASDYQADLVLKTTHHHNPIKKMLLSNTDWQLIRHCEAALWLVKQANRSIHSVCASIDPLHEADKPAALDYKLIQAGKAVANTLGASMSLVHSYNPLPRTLVFDASVITDYDGYANQLRDRHADAFNQVAEKAGISESQRTLLQGYPEEVIPGFTEEKGVDLLLMGAVSRSRLDSALIGHTAERLLDDVPCDVLVIKPDGFRDPSKPD